ncbi:MAG: HEAT repeat domain-containing protein [Actinobacteria bacterium]|nr:HEAT repeat domain-containing protein [Actinomycetota bacterium]
MQTDGIQGNKEGTVAKAALDILARLAVACKSRLLYHADHPAVRDAIVVLHAVAADWLARFPEINLGVERDGFVCGEERVGWERESLRQLASRARAHNLRAVSLSAALDLAEMEALVEILVLPPEELEEAGGAEAFLLGRGLHGIRVLESEAWRADEEVAGGEEGATREAVSAEEPPREPQELLADEELEDFLALVFDPERFAQALERLRDESGETPDGAAWAEAAFSSFKRAADLVAERLPAKRPALGRALAETLLFLERNDRNLLLSRKILPELAREPVCVETLGGLSSEEMAGVLGYFLPTAVEFIPGLKELLTNIGYNRRDALTTIAALRERLVDLGEVPADLLSPLDETLRDAGFADAAMSMPTLQEISLLAETYQPQEIEEIRRIADWDLAQETYVSVTPMLLDLLQLGGRVDNLGKTVELLLESFWGLLASSRFGLAAEVLEKAERALHSGDPAYAPFRAELERLLEEASDRDILDRLIKAASAARRDPGTVWGFTRFIEQLGERGILAMIDTLGREESMSVRKFIIDVLAVVARDRLSLLASYLDDPRWYLVRNIVTVMARVRSPLVMEYLDRALQYPNPKVKAEAVRAAGLTGGYEAEQLLMKGLQDGEENVRILCIRWLGRLQVARAANRLVAMLEDKEPGGESPRVKREIIECLGKIGGPEAFDEISRYAGRQRFFFRAEWQELSKAAQEAMRLMQERYPHLEKRKAPR